MGLFKKFKEKAKKTLGFTPPGIGILAGIEGAFDDPFGTKAAEKAAREAAEQEKDIAQQNLNFRKTIFGETAGFRERAGVASEELLSLAQTPLSESEDFQRDLKESLVQLRLTLGAFSLGDSTTFGTAAGETTAELASQERGRRASLLSFLAGGAETGLGPSVGAQGLATQAGLSAAQTTADIGAMKAQGKQAKLQTGADLLTLGVLLA